MGKKRHKTKARQKPKAKKKEATENDEVANRRGQDAVGHALSSGWVQNSTVAFLGTIILLVVAMWTNTQVKAAAITAGLMGTVAIWVFVGVIIAFNREPLVTFSLLFKNFDGSHRADRGFFWCRYNSGFGDTLSPVPVALYINVKNLTAAPLRIEKLQGSLQKQGKKWTTLRLIPSAGCRLYWIDSDLKKAMLLHLDGLDERLQSNIPAGETIPGWLFLATTEQYLVSSGDKTRWKLRSRDSAGNEAEYISAYEPINDKLLSPLDAVQSVPIEVTGITEDLSKLRLRIYEPLSN